MSVENFFDTCTGVDLSLNNLTSVSCSNFLNDQIYYIVSDVNKDIANCKYHMCFINTDFSSLTKTSVSCSGTILQYGTDSFFNGLVDKSMIMSKVKVLPRSIIDTISLNLDYYYIKDVRTSFDKQIESVTCGDNFRTVLTFVDGSTVTWGNIDDLSVYHGPAAFGFGLGMTLLSYMITFVLFTYFLEVNYDLNYRKTLRMIVFTSLLLITNMSVLIASVVEMSSFLIGIILIFFLACIFEFRKDIATYVNK